MNRSIERKLFVEEMYAMVTADVRARVSIHLDATPEAVFDAWIVPSMMERWFFKLPSNDIAALTTPVPGGTYSITEYSSGQVIAQDGRSCPIRWCSSAVTKPLTSAPLVAL
ncbi:hypothetical protein FJ546_03165 [Mesorhizobium sp. B2-4-19]|nr:hypothetical protein FJ546_03165 [Mesorhizobium sp. B2-4-19]